FECRKTSVRESTSLLVDLGLNEFGELAQGFLPAEVTGFAGDHIRNALLLDAHFRADRYGLQSHGGGHLARQIGVVESVSVDEPLAGNDLSVGAAEGVAAAGREVAERHSVLAPDLGFQFVN